MVFYFIRTSLFIFTTYLRQERQNNYKGIPAWKYFLMGFFSVLLPVLYFLFVTQHEMVRFGNFFFEYAFLQINKTFEDEDDTKKLEYWLNCTEFFISMVGPITCFIISLAILFVINFFARAIKNRRKEMSKQHKNELFNVNNRGEDMINQLRRYTKLNDDDLDVDTSLSHKYEENQGRKSKEVYLAVNDSQTSLESSSQQQNTYEQKQYLKQQMNQIAEEEKESSQGSSRLSHLISSMESRVSSNRSTILDVIEQ